MSKEFEEVVLKKLDVLTTEVKDTNQRLSNLEEEVNDTKQRLSTLENEVKDTNQRLNTLEIDVKETKQDLQELSKETKQNLLQLAKDTNEIVTDLRQKFVVFDFEINKKIDTLFDANTVNLEKHVYFQEKIISLDEKNFNHDIRISALEDATKSLTA